MSVGFPTVEREQIIALLDTAEESCYSVANK